MLVVQIYVYDIIFSTTNKTLYQAFAKVIEEEFEMSMIGELNFFFRLQIKQTKKEIFVNQNKYIKKILKKFEIENAKPIDTPMIM